MKRVLLVEDNLLNAELVEQLLEDTYDVCHAADGEQGVAEAHRVRPDVILMDLSMPRMDGETALRALRGSEFTRRVPVVALTAHAIKGRREQTLALGFDDFLTKPVDEDALLAVLDRLIGR